MAANRFATLIHRKTNRITLILVYAFLEWSLIFFILLNSLFSYFILRFADYFGLKRPCLFCSRLDRFFDASFSSRRKSLSHRDLLCDDHALEISNSQQQQQQQRLRTVVGHTHSTEPVVEEVESHKEDFFLVDGKISSSLCAPIVSDLGIVVDYPIGDEGQVYNGLMFPPSIFSGSVNLNHSSQEPRVEEETEEDTVIETVPQSPEKFEEDEVSSDSSSSSSDEEEFSCYVSSYDCNKEVVIVEEKVEEEEEENKVDLAIEVETSESAPKQNLEFYIDEEDCHLIPVEFYKPSDEVREISDINGDFILDFGAEPEFTEEKEEVIITAANESKAEEEEEDVIMITPAEVAVTTNPGASTDDLLEKNDEETDTETDTETDAEVSIGTEIPDHEQLGDVTSQQQLNPNGNDDNDDHDETEEDTLEFRTITNINEERFRETPASLERSHSLHNAMFHLERRVCGTESVDGIECSEGGVLTVDKLKLELQEERKALTALYEELEEERNASAIAANETMAMINRLHEEKSAMQMEALQYQRMMEEQAEFDQEALQLLNELMVNREKENAELEKELDLYRKRLEEFEAKEKMGMLRRRMRDSSVDSYRHNGDSDENNNNGEVHHHHKDVKGVSDWKYSDSEMENTPVDVVLRLDECLDDYEGERLSILGRLKFLEEKLTDLNNEEDEEVKTFENGNGHFHGKATNGKHRVIKSKRLLPLFDAVDGELQENGLGNGNHHENGIDESESGENVTIEEEVDELYERLEALEADREFLRHCVGSLKKGDKGVHLLHEILQHLRDLRNIDLNRVKENGDMSF